VTDSQAFGEPGFAFFATTGIVATAGLPGRASRAKFDGPPPRSESGSAGGPHFAGAVMPIVTGKPPLPHAPPCADL